LIGGVFYLKIVVQSGFFLLAHIIGPNVSPLEGLIIDKGEEIRKFLAAAKALNHNWYPIWAFAILTGMRSGELHAMTWDQIDLEKKLIPADRSYH
jgi:integrase